MTPYDGREDGALHSSPKSIELLLLESMIHHLVEKGVLTRNDVLSIVQTAAEVGRAAISDDGDETTCTERDLSVLGRMYSSFEALPETGSTAHAESDNIRILRPPLHGDHPVFPKAD